MSAVWVVRDASDTVVGVSLVEVGGEDEPEGYVGYGYTITRETLLTDNQRAVIQIAMWWADEHTKDKLGPITCSAENELVTAVTILRRDNATV